MFPIVQIIIGLGMMFGAGASSYISRLLGKGDNEQADKTASTSLFSGLLVGAIIIIGIMIFLDPVLMALGSTETILPYARAYAKIYVTGSIINVFTVMMNNLLTAQGATKFTMIAMLTGSIANVILDPIMLYGMDLGIEGAAIVLFIFADPIVSLFGTDVKMVGIAAKALRLNAVLFITFGFQMVYASLYLAIGKSLVGSVLSLGRQGIFFFFLVFVLPHLMGLTGVVWVQPMADLLTAILTLVFAVRINHALSTEIEMGAD